MISPTFFFGVGVIWAIIYVTIRFVPVLIYIICDLFRVLILELGSASIEGLKEGKDKSED